MVAQVSPARWRHWIYWVGREGTREHVILQKAVLLALHLITIRVLRLTIGQISKVRLVLR